VFVTNDTKVKLIVSAYYFFHQTRVSHSSADPLDLDLTEPIDIYSEWIDAADAAQREEPPRRSVASTSRGVTRAPAYESDDE